MLPYSFLKNKSRSKINFFLIFLVCFFLAFIFSNIESCHAQESNAMGKAVVWAADKAVETILTKMILPFIGWLVSLAVSLMAWAIDPASIKKILSSTSLYLIWKNVRDFLNIAFILFLLFSAFCTIFQVKNYSYKSVLLNLILMALLVNFSYPIARFIIDVSNVLMYTLLNGLFSGSDSVSMLVEIAQQSKIKEISAASLGDVGKRGVQLLAVVIFLFIFGVTILVMAVLFIIRTIVLALLIVFSPVAFTGTIIPGLKEFATKWWSQLFNQAFFGPVMIFMLYVALGLMSAISSEMSSTINTVASKQSEDGTFIAYLCQFIVPIVILWMGMITAKQMGAVGAGTVVGFAEGKLKGIGKSLSGYNFIKSQYDAFAGARKKRKDEINKNRFGGKFGDWLNKTQDSAVGTIPFAGESAKKRLLEMERKKTHEKMEDWKKYGTPEDSELRKLLTSKNSAIARAAATKLSQAGKLSIEDYTNITSESGIFKNDRVALGSFNDEVKKKQRDLVLISKLRSDKNFDLDKELSSLETSDLKSINFENLHKNGGQDALEKYFGNMSDDDKIQVGRNVNKTNRSFLRDKMFK